MKKLFAALAVLLACLLAGCGLLDLLLQDGDEMPNITGSTLALQPEDFYAYTDEGERVEYPALGFYGSREAFTYRGVGVGDSSVKVLAAYGGLLCQYTYRLRGEEKTMEGVPLLETWYETDRPGSFSVFLPLFVYGSGPSAQRFTYENQASMPDLGQNGWEPTSSFTCYRLWIDVEYGEVVNLASMEGMGG